MVDKVAIEVDGTQEVLAKLKNVDQKMKQEADRIIQDFALRVEVSTVDNIKAGGIPFVALSPYTFTQKVQQGYTPWPLVRTGEMLNSVRSEKVAEMQAQVVVAAPYAIYHELGAPSANIPKRPFLIPAVQSNTPQLEADIKKLKEIKV